eukprot:TRINITY_DN13460_c0_g1_i1.p1 TRINITY_DN13460_c0_g1~~TRINITY_DN13460_c0_g1_i1.p1  ORF type:complete len:568 (+),score=146.66 TRINITY_DN13460_c0_g1_i1:1589-3292(+)
MGGPRQSVPDTTPVIVGVARYTHRVTPDLSNALTPLELMVVAAKQACEDAGVWDAAAGKVDVDCIATVPHMHVSLLPPGTELHYSNAPKSLAKRLNAGAALASENLYTHPMGGNGPQELVNAFGQKIADGEINSVLIAGSEALATWRKARGLGMTLPGVTSMHDMTGRRTFFKPGEAKELPWGDHPGGTPKMLYKDKLMFNRMMVMHGFAPAPAVYALFEQEYRRAHGDISRKDYQHQLGTLLAQMSEIAAAHPQDSWVPQEKSADDIATASPSNRMVYYPYTKTMNSYVDVDQASALLVMSVGEARRRGVPEGKWVFVHAHADAHELPDDVLQRASFLKSPALRTIKARLEDQLGAPLASVSHREIYSCFPIAVKLAAQELGIPWGSATELTVTGGMQFHGGPGNNFGTHMIAAMVERLRSHPGEQGLVTNNGGYLTKHSAAVYSTAPAVWQRRQVAEDKKATKALSSQLYPSTPKLAKKPSGRGVVHLWTAEHDNSGFKRLIALGTLTATGERFLANCFDASVATELMNRDVFDIPCEVTCDKVGKAVFTPLSYTSVKSKGGAKL